MAPGGSVLIRKALRQIDCSLECLLIGIPQRTQQLVFAAKLFSKFLEFLEFGRKPHAHTRIAFMAANISANMVKIGASCAVLQSGYLR